MSVNAFRANELPKTNENQKTLFYVTYVIGMKEWERWKNAINKQERVSWGELSPIPYFLIGISRTAIVVQSHTNSLYH